MKLIYSLLIICLFCASCRTAKFSVNSENYSEKTVVFKSNTSAKVSSDKVVYLKNTYWGK